jgi:DNA-binding LacI/PurR family transcriptional regulator
MSLGRTRNNLMPATAHDVARVAGVSQSAVSRAFTPGGSVAPDTRLKIIEAARQLGYRPNVIARSLITRRSRVIGLVAAYLQNHFYPDVLELMSNRLKAEGYHVLLFTADAGASADPLLEEIIGYRVDGLILASTTLSSTLAADCSAASIPVLLFNRTAQVEHVSSVTGENHRGGRVIAEFLLAGGHKRLAFVAGVENSSTSIERETGFNQVMAERNLPPPMRAVGHYTFEGAQQAARDLLNRKDRPDAIFCGNDHMALAVAEVARFELGLRIPEDVSLVGFDNVGPAAWSSFALTTFTQPVKLMVESAVDLMMGQIADPGSPVQRIVVPGDLIVRGSARVPGDCIEIDGQRVWRPSGT